MKIYPLTILLASICLASCSLVPASWRAGHAAPTAVITPEGQITVSGNAATPAHVNEATTHATLPIPVASTVTTSPADGTIKVQVSAPTTLTVDTKQTKVDGPVAFTPPAPPTPSQIADGQSKSWLYIALFAGCAAGVFGLVEGWKMVMLAGAVVAGASVIGLFIVNHPVLTYIIVGAVVFGGAGVFLWHSKIKGLSAELEAKKNDIANFKIGT